MFSGLLNLPWWGDVIALLVLVQITIAGVTIYLHRCQAHRALELHPVISHFFRFFTSLGSAGSFGFAGFGVAVGPARAATFPPGAAVPQAANAAAAIKNAAATMVMRFIQPLLLRW